MDLQILKRVMVAFFVTIVLVLFFHQHVLAGELLAVEPVILEGPTFQPLECGNIKNSLQEMDLLLNSTHNNMNDKLVSYISQISLQYGLWHMELAPYENTEASWAMGYFLPLVKSAESIEVSKARVYLWNSNIEDFLYVLEAQIQDTDCISDSPQKEEALEKLAHFISVHSEHLSTSGDFLSRMQPRLSVQYQNWQKFEGDVAQRIQDGCFSFLKSESDVFSEAAMLVQSNANYVRAAFADLQKSMEALLLPLAPRP